MPPSTSLLAASLAATAAAAAAAPPTLAASLHAAPPGNATTPRGGICVDLVSPHTPRGVALDNAVVALPALLFTIYLASTARASARRLAGAQSFMLWAYWLACWAVSLLSLARAALLTAGGAAHPAGGAGAALTGLWLATRAATTTVELSAVVFLLQGYGASSVAALTRTLAAAGGAAAVDLAAQAGLAFGPARVPLFTWGGPGPRGTGDLRSVKWAYWFIRETTLSAGYGALVALPRTSLASLLPARRSFFRYAAALAAVHGSTAAGTLLLLLGWSFGYCAVGAGFAAFFAAGGPALYAAFLAPFFRDAAFDQDMSYYSEMRDAGYLSDGGGSEFF